MVSRRGGAGWEEMEGFGPNVPQRTTSHPTTRALRSLFGPVVASLLWGSGRASGRARERGVPGHCLGRACFRWQREGVGWSGGGEAGAEPLPLEGPGEPSACRERGGGLLGAVRWGEIVGATEIPLGQGRGASMPRPFLHSRKLSLASPAMVTFHGPRSPGTQVPSYLAKNGGREPRPQAPCK